MPCDFDRCREMVIESHTEIFGIGGKGGLREMVCNLKKEIKSKVGITIFMILVSLVAIPAVTWGWIISTNHESRIRVMEANYSAIVNLASRMNETLNSIDKKLDN